MECEEFAILNPQNFPHKSVSCTAANTRKGGPKASFCIVTTALNYLVAGVAFGAVVERPAPLAAGRRAAPVPVAGADGAGAATPDEAL